MRCLGLEQSMINLAMAITNGLEDSNARFDKEIKEMTDHEGDTVQIF